MEFYLIIEKLIFVTKNWPNKSEENEQEMKKKFNDKNFQDR